MSSLSRLIVLGIFAAIGVGLAICVALSDRPTPVSSATPRLAVKTVVEPAHGAAEQATLRSSSPAANSFGNEPCGDQSTSEPNALQAADASPRVQPPAAVAIIGPAPIAADAPCNEQRYLVARPAPLIEIHAHHDGPDWVASVPHPSSTVASSPPLPPLPPDDDNGPSLPILETPSPAIEQEVTPPSNAQTKQQVRQSLDELRAMLEQGSIPPPPEPGDKANATGRAAPPPNPLEPQTTKSAPPVTPSARSRPKIVKSGEGDDHLSLDFQDADIRDVLELISHEGGLNILPSNSVKGKVSASLHDVNLQTALSAILKSTGYVTRRQGNMIYVGTSKDFQDLEQAVDKVGTRIYQTNYVRAADLQALIQPLLTPNGIGTCTVTPASETGIAVDNNKAGGDTFAGGDSLLVRDYEAVLAQVDQVVAQIDKRPMQVAIEAMILSVKLDDASAFGINFSALRDKLHLKLLSGTPSDALSSVVAGNGGMNFAFLDTSLGVFLEALETVGDTNVIATPHLTCINKHPAQILIGSQLGYISSTVTETSTAQNVNFLEVGAQLRLRPFISTDGQIRMEVHPELSTGQVKLEGGFTLPEKDVTQVTTNVMIRDGATVIIGGLMREDLISNTTQIPYLGSLPGVGWLFRQKSDETVRSEILVLITPHIVYDAEACAEGSKGAEEFHRRQAVYADQMCAASKVHLGQQHYRLAQQAWAAGDQATALRYIDLSIHYDPANRAAIDLRSDILTGNHFDKHTAVNFPTPVGDGHPAGGPMMSPQIIDELQHPAGPLMPPPISHHPLDPGVTGGSTKIERPKQFESP
jgi:type IV pilus assembly protein PilQ